MQAGKVRGPGGWGEGGGLQRGVHRGGGRVGGLIAESELQQLKEALGVPAKTVTELAGSLSGAAILGSFKVWCSRNIQQL